jgi:hypothetical protein
VYRRLWRPGACARPQVRVLQGWNALARTEPSATWARPTERARHSRALHPTLPSQTGVGASLRAPGMPPARKVGWSTSRRTRSPPLHPRS